MKKWKRPLSRHSKNIRCNIFKTLVGHIETTSTTSKKQLPVKLVRESIHERRRGARWLCGARRGRVARQRKRSPTTHGAPPLLSPPHQVQ